MKKHRCEKCGAELPEGTIICPKCAKVLGKELHNGVNYGYGKRMT